MSAFAALLGINKTCEEQINCDDLSGITGGELVDAIHAKFCVNDAAIEQNAADIAAFVQGISEISMIDSGIVIDSSVTSGSSSGEVISHSSVFNLDASILDPSYPVGWTYVMPIVVGCAGIYTNTASTDNIYGEVNVRGARLARTRQASPAISDGNWDSDCSSRLVFGGSFNASYYHFYSPSGGSGVIRTSITIVGYLVAK